MSYLNFPVSLSISTISVFLFCKQEKKKQNKTLEEKTLTFSKQDNSTEDNSHSPARLSDFIVDKHFGIFRKVS